MTAASEYARLEAALADVEPQFAYRREGLTFL